MVSKNEKPSINIPKPKPKPKPEKIFNRRGKFAIWKKARKDAYDEKKKYGINMIHSFSKLCLK